MLLLIALILSICTFAQNVAVTKQLKAKYSIVEYNKSNGGWYLIGKQFQYLQPIITQYFIDNKSEIWLLFLIAHSKR